MKKKILLFVICAVILLGFCGCQGRDSIADAEVWSTVIFGNYEQDNDLSNGKEPIEWLVLEKDEESVLLLSKYALDARPYNSEEKYVTWENAELRAWLEDEFISAAFSEKEISRIAVTENKNPGVDEYKIPAGNDTKDRVFLLNVPEFHEYFGRGYTMSGEPEVRPEGFLAFPTEYAKARGAEIRTDGATVWWLRSCAEDGGWRYRVACVDDLGRAYNFCRQIERADVVVRPAVRINISAK